MKILISVNPPYANMILDNEKFTEYRKKIITSIKKGDVLYIYETKNGGGVGAVIGMVTVDEVYKPMYLNSDKYTSVTERNNAIKSEYIKWCTKNHISPNMNEGWFKSKKFITHFNKIGGNSMGYNYAISLSEPQKFNEYIPITCFVNEKEITLAHPPRNMCKLSDNNCLFKN